MQARGAKLAEAHQRNHDAARSKPRSASTRARSRTARISAELWDQIKNEDWSLVSDVTFFSCWPPSSGISTKHYQYIGGRGRRYGVGYGAPASVGAALANRKYGRISVNIQYDGDLNYAPGVLWTAAHHKIPLLTIMHNNRAYHQE